MLKNALFVIPAKAGIQLFQQLMDSGFRRNDIFQHSSHAADLKLNMEFIPGIGPSTFTSVLT